MSRVGKQAIDIPAGVTVNLGDGNRIIVKGPLGELMRSFRPELTIRLENRKIIVDRRSQSKLARSLHGLTRSLIANMIRGVSTGFEKKLELHGVGYRVAKKGESILLQVGFTHPIEFKPPSGVELEVETKQNMIKVSGIDKELVGTVAAKIRAAREPEPYKGKGICYVGEYVRRKEGKKGVT